MTGVVIFAAAVAFWWFVIRNILKGTKVGGMALAVIAVVCGIVFTYNLTREILFGDPKHPHDCIDPFITMYGREC